MGMEHETYSGGDLGSLQDAMQLVEQACLGLQEPSSRAAAEATLLAFRRSHYPIQACQYILEHSHMANARFQAAAALQEAALREWGFFRVEEKNNLRSYCLHYVTARSETLEAYVLSKVSAVAAVLMKRGWLEMVATEKEAFFNEVKQAVLGAHGLAAQRSGIAFVESLVSEFAPSTASAIGLSVEFHEHCRASLELDYLQTFYAWGQDTAVTVAERILQGLGSTLEVNVCASALRLMSQLLCWEFQGTLIRGAGGVIVVGKTGTNAFSTSMGRENFGGRRSGDHTTLVQPGPAWQNLLISPNRIHWLLELYTRFRQCASDDKSWIDSPLAVSTRQLIVQLCSLSGNIFPSDGGTTHEQHMQLLLSAVTTWLSPPEAVISSIKSGKSESELIDGCRALLSIATLSSPSSFDQLLKPLASTLNLLSSLTQEVIKKCGQTCDEEQTWTEETLEILLDTWTVLLQPADLSKRIPFPPSGVEAAAAVFQTFVDTELRVAAASAHDEGDGTEQLHAAIAARDERLGAFALIARAAPAASIPLLAELVTQHCSLIHQCRGGRSDPTPILEELHWLLLMSGHVLADPGDGETPVVPESILAQISFTENPSNHPAVLLSHSAITLAQQSLDGGLRAEIFSSRLMEAIVWFFSRWADTYLMPADAGRGPSSTPSGHESDQQHTMAGTHYDGRNALLAAFGEQGNGKAVLETLLQVGVTSLTSWPGERNLHEITCFQLLPSLVRRRNICAHIVSMGAWQELAKAFAFQDLALLVFAAPIQRALAETLCRSASGMESGDNTNQYVKDLMVPIACSLSDLSSRPDLKNFAQQPDAILMVCCLIERLRGAARAVMPRSQKAIFEVGAAVMEPLLIFLEVYKNQSAVVYALLKYVVDWVDGQVAFLEAKDTAILFNFCVRLLQIYSTHNIGKVSLSTSKNLLTESQTEKYKDLRALLQLLTNLSSKDLVDFASDGNDEVENPDVAQVVYLGLHIINPLISVDLLKYPKLCRQYFTLLAHMLEVYPEKIAKLSTEAFGHIVGTLDFGLRHQGSRRTWYACCKHTRCQCSHPGGSFAPFPKVSLAVSLV
eukprot:c22631_g1_i2 orf=152-3370(+)